MKKLLVLLVAAAAGPWAAAQEEAAREDLSQWRSVTPIRLPSGSGGKYVTATLTPSAFGGASPTLQDVRLADDKGRPLAYAVVRLDGRVERRDLTPVREFDRVTLPDRSERVTFDLGERPTEHNSLRLDVTARSYGRGVLLEGGDDGRSFNRLFGGELVNLSIDGQAIDRRSFEYPPSRARYLRVTLKPDRVEPTPAPVLGGVQFGYVITHPGRMAGGPPQSVRPREPVRRGEAASAWTVELPDVVPVSRLRLEVTQPAFSRPYRIEALSNTPGEIDRAEGPGGAVIASGLLRREDGDGPVTLSFPEARARRLRLVVIDSRNAPLDLRVTGYEAVARVLVFRAPSDGAAVSLYSGNPAAPPPNYEFTAPARLDGLAEAAFAGREENPGYVPPPPPSVAWTEKNRWLLDAALVVSLTALAALLWRLASDGIRRHDARPAA